jgi:hypothetical protein
VGDDMSSMDAETEIGIGEEREIHTITTPTSVYIPKEIIHCSISKGSENHFFLGASL